MKQTTSRKDKNNMPTSSTNNVIQFKTQDTLTTTVTRCARWAYDTGANSARFQHRPDFTIHADHESGSTPFDTVVLSVFISGRQSDEYFGMTKTDVLAMSELFATVAEDMTDDKE